MARNKTTTSKVEVATATETEDDAVSALDPISSSTPVSPTPSVLPTQPQGAAAWPANSVERRRIDELIPYARNARTHSPTQVAQLAASIKEWGWTIPVLVDETGGIIAGHGRILAARQLGIDEIPVMVAGGWTDAQKRAYVIADNKLAMNAGWDEDLLRIEITELTKSNFNVDLVGFSEDELAEFFLPPSAADEEPTAGAGDAAASGDMLRFGKHKIPLDKSEVVALEALAARYAETFGVTHGFARWIGMGDHVDK
jgi:hypothetical protein